MRRAILLSVGALGAAAALAFAVRAIPSGDPADLAEIRAALSEARQQGAEAQVRAERLEAEAAAAGAAAQRSAAQGAALAARIQEAQAAVGAAQANASLLATQQEALRARLAQRQQPVLQLTAALQLLARRPLLFAVFQPGSVRDAVYLRAMLATVTPQIANRTAALRGELDQARLIAARSRAAVEMLRREQGGLAERQARLAATEGRQRVAARQSAGSADREAERALALAEQARDLGSLADELGRAGQLRGELAALPGPVMRPVRGTLAGQAIPVLPVSGGETARPAAQATLRFMLPVQGRIVAGFGAAVQGQPRSRGLSIAVRPDALAIAPAAGRIVFAGPWRGFGQIVIVDHGQGWTSTVTGLARLGVNVGLEVVSGAPLGSAGPGRPVIGIELRQSGEAVNPLDFAGL